MSNILIEKLASLTLERTYLKRELDKCGYDREKRKEIFLKMQNTNENIKHIKFKLELERKMKNDSSSRSR